MPTAGAIMDQAAELLNDSSKTLYPYAAQLPYLKSAYRIFALELQDAGVPVLKEISATIDVSANAVSVSSPSDLVQPISLKERADGTTDLFTDVEEVSDIPQMDQVDNIICWAWREEVITINSPATAREVLLHYWKSLTALVDQSSSISLLNSQDYLAYRTAALCAKYIGENQTRSVELNQFAESLKSLVIGLEVKARQSEPVRPKGYGKSKKGFGRLMM